MRFQDVWKRALEVVSRDFVAREAHFFWSKPWFWQTQNVEAVEKSDWHWSTVSSSVCAWPWMALSVLIDLSLCKQWQNYVCVCVPFCCPMCGIERASTQPAEAVMTADGEMRDNETCAWPWMALSVLIDLSLCKQWQRSPDRADIS